MPRPCKNRPSAPETIESTTSLSVPPARCRRSFTRSRSIRNQSKRRCGPMAGFNGVADDGRKPAATASPMPVISSRSARHAARGSRHRIPHAAQRRDRFGSAPTQLAHEHIKWRRQGGVAPSGPARAWRARSRGRSASSCSSTRRCPRHRSCNGAPW